MIGNLVCELEDSKEVHLQLEKTLIIRKDKEKLVRPFLNSRVGTEKAGAAMMNFAKTSKFGKEKPKAL